MAAVLGAGTAAGAMACSSSKGLPLQQGGVVCSSGVSMGAASSMLRVSSNGRAVIPACRGLKVARRRVRGAAAATGVVRASQGRKLVLCEAPEIAVGGTRLEHGAAGVVSDQTFQKLVLESDVPVLVDFWAPWCGPCRMIAPIIDELARQYAGKIRCLKLNTDESPCIATEYGIRSIPTVMIFKRGEKKDTVIGAVPKSTLTATIEKYLDW